jgi:hypothetical protein
MADTRTETEEKFKYIDIANWDEKQMGGGTLWVKDYTDKESDYHYIKLTALQRYVYDALCRIRARTAQRIHNDPTYVARAAQMLPRDRTHVAQAIRRLYTDGLLLLTNEPLNLQNRVEKNRVDKNRTDYNYIASKNDDISTSSSINGTETKAIEQTDADSAEDFAQIWMKLMAFNQHWDKRVPPMFLLTKDFEKLLKQWEPWQLHELVAFSQFGIGQAQFNHTTRNLLKSSVMVDDIKNRIKKKKDGMWDRIQSRYNSILAGEQLLEDDESKTTTKKMTSDEIDSIIDNHSIDCTCELCSTHWVGTRDISPPTSFALPEGDFDLVEDDDDELI